MQSTEFLSEVVMGGQSSQVKVNPTEQNRLESIDEIEPQTNIFESQLKCDYKDYRSVVTFKYCNALLLQHNFCLFSKIPSTVMSLISSYIPSLYQIYKISKTKLKSPSRAPSPSPSISSVSSVNSYASHASYSSFDGNHNHSNSHRFVNQIERMYEWDTMIYSLSNIYHCGNKYFIKAANNEIYGMGTKSGNKSLGKNIALMSNGICAGNIAIKYRNGYIYTSKYRAKSFNKFAGLKNINIISIQCGYQHTLFLSMDGKCYAQGDNSKGQCGLGDLMIDGGQIAIIETFVKLNCFITSISCGYQHSVCIDSIQNKMYTFGDNQYYQCSPDMKKKCIKIPTMYAYLDKIDDTVNIIKAECGKVRLYSYKIL